MKKSWKKAALLLILCSFPATAGVPAFVTYSGRLTDGTGWGESAEATLVFNLYDSDDLQAEPFWYTTHENVPIVDGYFTVNLGMCPQDGGPCVTNPADATFPADLPNQMWVGVEVGGVELAPRQAVGSVPYAMRAAVAEQAESLGGFTAGENMRLGVNAAAAVLCWQNVSSAYGRTILETGQSGDARCGEPPSPKACSLVYKLYATPEKTHILGVACSSIATYAPFAPDEGGYVVYVACCALL